MTTRRSLVALVLSNLLGGVGVATGIAVGSLLLARMGGTAMAGLGPALSVLGAAVLAVPLARLATRRGRRVSLTTGYVIAATGATVVLVAARLDRLPLVLLGLVGFGAAQATNLQSRYAASELSTAQRRATTMSVVIWATTIGSVLGPNLSAAGAALGRPLGLPELAGPYLFGVVAFSLAAVAISALFVRHAPQAQARPRPAISAPRALLWANRHPVARFAIATIVVGHAVMVGIMSMTPVHLGHELHRLDAIGFVISLHILGMYALSPLVGWLADRFGAMRNALVGLILLGAAALLVLAAPTNLVVVVLALFLLGVGWSFTTISGSAMLARVDSGEVRVPLQGATDALMNYAGAAAALLGGPALALLGFGGLAVVAGALVLPVALVGRLARRHRDTGFAATDQR